MTYIEAAAVNLLVSTVVIACILWLAHRSGDPDAPPLRLARRHGMWAALLALLAGGVLGQPPFAFLSGYWTADQASRIAEPRVLQDLAQAAGPFLALVGVYVLAQYTGPRRRSDVRVVDLAVRRLRDYLPVRLCVFTGVLALLAAASIATTAGLPAIDREPGAGQDAAMTLVARVPGYYFALVSGTAYLLLLLGTLFALVVIVARPRVGTLTHVEDSIMRRVFINRLLRTIALVTTSVLNGCLEFAALGQTDASWGTARFVLAVLWFATVVVVLAARPRFEPAEVDRQVDAPLLAPEGSLRRAVLVTLSGRRLGYAAWALGMVPLLLTIGAPIGGLLNLVVLCSAYVLFQVAQLCAELFLAQNHGEKPQLHWSSARRLPASLLLVAVPTCVTVAGVAWLGGWIATLPGASAELPFWTAAYALVLGVSLLVLLLGAFRPAIREAVVEDDRRLRAASIRRALLMLQSAMLALAAFLVSDNRYALAAAVGDRTATGPYPADQGEFAALILTLMLGAVLLAVLPGRRFRTAQPAPSTGAAP